MKLKKFKRNAVIITVIAFICVGVYLNWAYNNKAAGGDVLDAAEPVDAPMESAAGSLYYGDVPAEVTAEAEPGLSDKAADYFASARLTREKSRDSAIEMLRETAESETAAAEAQSEAVAAMAQLSDNAIKESQIENILIAKGFADCMVYIDAEDVSVIVPAEAAGLSESDVARITEVISAETSVTAEHMKIIEVN